MGLWPHTTPAAPPRRNKLQLFPNAQRHLGTSFEYLGSVFPDALLLFGPSQEFVEFHQHFQKTFGKSTYVLDGGIVPLANMRVKHVATAGRHPFPTVFSC